MSVNDPYRDSLENKVNRLEDEIRSVSDKNQEAIDTLDRRINDAKLVPSIWGTVRSSFYNLTHWDGWGEGFGFACLVVIGIVLICVFAVPSCLRSCSADSERERESITREREAACEALGLRYMASHVEGTAGNTGETNYIVCAGENRIVYVNPVHPDRTYSRTIDQLEHTTIPREE